MEGAAMDGWVQGILFVTTSVTLLAIYVLNSRAWTEVRVGSTRDPEPVLAAYRLLRDHDVRCRLRQVGSAAQWFTASGSAIQSLLVHRSDLQAAKRLLAQRLPATQPHA